MARPFDLRSRAQEEGGDRHEGLVSFLGTARPSGTRASRPQARIGGTLPKDSPSRAVRTPAFPEHLDSRFRGNDQSGRGARASERHMPPLKDFVP